MPTTLIQPVYFSAQKLKKTKSLADKKTAILSQIQGEPVVFSDNTPLGVLLLAFALALEVSPAIFLKSQNKIWTLFDFLPETEELDIKADLSYSFAFPEPKNLPPKTKQTIDLEKIASAKENFPTLSEAKIFIRRLKEFAHPAQVTVIKGKVSPMLYLLAIRFLKNLTAEIWWQKNKKEALLIYASY